MSVPIIIGVLALLVVLVAAGGMRRRNAQTPAGAQTVWMVVLVLGVAAILLYFVLGRRF